MQPKQQKKNDFNKKQLILYNLCNQGELIIERNFYVKKVDEEFSFPKKKQEIKEQNNPSSLQTSDIILDDLKNQLHVQHFVTSDPQKSDKLDIQFTFIYQEHQYITCDSITFSQKLSNNSNYHDYKYIKLDESKSFLSQKKKLSTHSIQYQNNNFNNNNKSKIDLSLEFKEIEIQDSSVHQYQDNAAYNMKLCNGTNKQHPIKVQQHITSNEQFGMLQSFNQVTIQSIQFCYSYDIYILPLTFQSKLEKKQMPIQNIQYDQKHHNMQPHPPQKTTKLHKHHKTGENGKKMFSTTKQLQKHNKNQQQQQQDLINRSHKEFDHKYFQDSYSEKNYGSNNSNEDPSSLENQYHHLEHNNHNSINQKPRNKIRNTYKNQQQQDISQKKITKKIKKQDINNNHYLQDANGSQTNNMNQIRKNLKLNNNKPPKLKAAKQAKQQQIQGKKKKQKQEQQQQQIQFMNQQQQEYDDNSLIANIDNNENFNSNNNLGENQNMTYTTYDDENNQMEAETYSQQQFQTSDNNQYMQQQQQQSNTINKQTLSQFLNYVQNEDHFKQLMSQCSISKPVHEVKNCIEKIIERTQKYSNSHVTEKILQNNDIQQLISLYIQQSGSDQSEISEPNDGNIYKDKMNFVQKGQGMNILSN